MYRKLLLVAVMAATLPLAASADGAEERCPKPASVASAARWPAPARAGAFDVVHFGEGHWNEGQGPKTMPDLVQDVKRFDPDMVLFSSDMADIGSPDRLGCFRSIMSPLVNAGIPWFNSPGNHDRVATAGPGGVISGDIDIYRRIFASMPAPWGDAAPAGPRYVLPKEEPEDGKGASTHYHFDYRAGGRRALRVIVLDNSQQGLTNSDPDQYPAVGPGHKDAGQLAYLERVAAEAQREGLMTWVVMHQPTQDPRDVSNAHPVSLNHVMGKGVSPDNLAFDVIAEQTGVDAVLLGHIQGNVEYSFGDVDFFIDGGGGGSPYALREVGTDTGYFYGFRILRAFKDRPEWGFRSYFVPLIDRIELRGPREIEMGGTASFSATAVQPFDPDLPPRLGAAPNEAIRLELRAADPTRPDAAHLPELAYVWKTSDPRVLAPVAEGDVRDPIFDSRRMSLSGEFKALRPGTATITIMSGTSSRDIVVTVR